MTNDLDILTVRRDLIATREKHGADTAIGHRCSNIVELIQNTEGVSGDVRTMVTANIQKQMADLAKLVNAEHHYTPQGE